MLPCIRSPTAFLPRIAQEIAMLPFHASHRVRLRSALPAAVRAVLAASMLFTLAGLARGADEAKGLIRSAKSGPWSAGTTWEGGKMPPALSKVQIRAGHTVT